MARTLEDFMASLPPEEQEAIHKETERLIAEEMTLRALRQARACSQEQVGNLLNIKQAAVSRLERRTDMYVSTLRSYIEAMGGELDIIARFPDHTPIRINQFEELGEVTPVGPSSLDRDSSRAPASPIPPAYGHSRAPVSTRPRRPRGAAAHARRQPVRTAPTA